MISFCMQDIANHLDKNVMDKIYKDIDIIYRPKKFSEVYLNTEKKSNKAIHKVVMKDNGIPTL